MDISDLLAGDGVKLLSGCSSKKRLFHELAEMGAMTLGLPERELRDALLEREALGPTGVGGGVALPHARMEGLDRVRGMFLRLETPLEFKSADRQPVDLVFALLAPIEAGVDHLKALALVARTMRDPARLTKLRANEDPKTLFTILTEPRSVQAA